MMIYTENGFRLIRATSSNTLPASNIAPQRSERERIAGLNDWIQGHNAMMEISQYYKRNLDYIPKALLEVPVVAADAYSRV